MKETTAATKLSTKKPKVSKAKAAKAMKAAKSSKGAAAKTEARAGSKKEIVLALLRREHGATLGEIAKATDWQNHSIRGFVSGHVTKKMGLKVESTRTDGERTYRILS